MFKILRTFLNPPPPTPTPSPEALGNDAPPADVVLPEGQRIPFLPNLDHAHGLPIADWQALATQVGRLPDPALQAIAWSACERAWLEHLRHALGPDYHVAARGDALLLSSFEARAANATLDFIARTLTRVTHLLDGIAAVPAAGQDILIVFDDDETYYRYVAIYYPDAGEFAGSSGMHIAGPCSHFVTTKSDLPTIEPVIAHEMTHACLAHLALPVWLNEGIAVNVEQRLCAPPPALFTPRQMHAKHRSYWDAAAIQEFWSGRSFLRAEDGNLLSYDLARIVVAQFAADIDAFRAFVLAAQADDAGAAAAREHLGVELGAVAAALLESDTAAAWSPDPAAWPAHRANATGPGDDPA